MEENDKKQATQKTPRLRKRKNDDADAVFIKRHVPVALGSLVQVPDPLTAAPIANGGKVHAANGNESGFRVIHYMGRTRVVVGPGLVVQELLFIGESLSLRVTAPVSAATVVSFRDVWNSPLLATARDKIYPLVETVVVDELDELDDTSSEVTERGLIVHLKNKSAVERFVDWLKPLNIKIETLIVEPPPRILLRPSVFTFSEFVGNVSVTRSASDATGAAEMEFASAADANAFVRSYLTGSLEIPGRPRILTRGYDEPNATIPGDQATDSEAAAKRKRKTKLLNESPWLPPLVPTYIGFDLHYILDEGAIQQMAVSDRNSKRYVVDISYGLALHVNEQELRALGRPHRCIRALIKRDRGMSDAIFADEKALLNEAFAAPLVSVQAATDSLFAWCDRRSCQGSVRLRVSDVEQVRDLYDRVRQSPLWTGIDKPYGQDIQISSSYGVQVSVPVDAYHRYSASIHEVVALARSSGVRMRQETTIESKTHIVYIIQSESRKAFERVRDELNTVGVDTDLRAAVAEFVEQHPREYAVCPQTGCHQIVSCADPKVDCDLCRVDDPCP